MKKPTKKSLFFDMLKEFRFKWDIVNVLLIVVMLIFAVINMMVKRPTTSAEVGFYQIMLTIAWIFGLLDLLLNRISAKLRKELFKTIEELMDHELEHLKFNMELATKLDGIIKGKPKRKTKAKN